MSNEEDKDLREPSAYVPLYREVRFTRSVDFYEYSSRDISNEMAR